MGSQGAKANEPRRSGKNPHTTGLAREMIHTDIEPGHPHYGARPSSMPPAPHPRAPEGHQTKPRSGARTLAHGANRGYRDKNLTRPKGPTPPTHPHHVETAMQTRATLAAPPGLIDPFWSLQPTAHAVGYGSAAPAGARSAAPRGPCGMRAPRHTMTPRTTPRTTALFGLLAGIRSVSGRSTRCSEAGFHSLPRIQTETWAQTLATPSRAASPLLQTSPLLSRM
jgi:hypothetical protein